MMKGIFIDKQNIGRMGLLYDLSLMADLFALLGSYVMSLDLVGLLYELGFLRPEKLVRLHDKTYELNLLDFSVNLGKCTTKSVHICFQ